MGWQSQPTSGPTTLDALPDTVITALDSLNTKYQDAIILHYLHGKSQQQVAQEMGCSTAAVTMRISRGLRKIRAIVGRNGLYASVTIADALKSFTAKSNDINVDCAVATVRHALDVAKPRTSPPAPSMAHKIARTFQRHQRLFTLSKVMLAAAGAVALLSLAAYGINARSRARNDLPLQPAAPHKLSQQEESHDTDIPSAPAPAHLSTQSSPDRVKMPKTAIPNGFYHVSNEPGAQQVAACSRKPDNLLSIGSRWIPAIDAVNLVSLANDNNSFRLTIEFADDIPSQHVPRDPNHGHPRSILVVDGIGHESGNWGNREERVAYLNFSICGHDNAKRIARYLGITPYSRHDPSPDLMVSFTTAERSFDAGEDVIINFRIVNMGSNSLSFRKFKLDKHNQSSHFHFSVRDRDGTLALRPDHPNQPPPFFQPFLDQLGDGPESERYFRQYILQGSYDVIRIEPNGIFEDTVNLSRWFSLSEAGTYEVLGIYYLDFLFLDSRRTIMWESEFSEYFSVSIE